MAFHCFLDNSHQFGSAGANEACAFANTTIGLDAETGHTFTLFSQIAILLPDLWEATFFIEEYDPSEDRNVYTYFRGSETKSFLDKEHRHLVLGHVHTMFMRLLTMKSPDQCVMYAMDPDLPLRALGKYMAVADAFLSSGYHVRRKMTRDRQAIWYFNRVAP